MSGSASGVSGSVQYDADVSCYNDHEGEQMFPTEETSDKGNTIFECPECDVRRAVNLQVVPVGGGG